MAFCTECGSKLPDDAIFCPNCGASMTAPCKNESSASEEVKTVDYSAPISDDSQNEAQSDATSFQTCGEYNGPTQENASVPVQETYVSPVQRNYASPFQGGYAPQPQAPYNPQNAYGYAPYHGGGVGVNTMPPKKKLSGGVIALIVIGAVILLACAICFIGYLFSQAQGPYVGYWESVLVDTGDGASEDFYGTSIVGAIDIQINSDGSAYLASAYDTEIEDATWEENDGAIVMSTSDEIYHFELDDGQLILSKNRETFYFEKADGDINHPTVPHGFFAGADNSTASNGVAGSGNVDNGDSYLSVIGSEEFTDVDGDTAIRVYYEYTNNFEDGYSQSAYNALIYDASQDGNQLQETYAANESSVENNSTYYIRQGLTIQCFVEFKYNPNGGSVDFNVYGNNDGESGGVVSSSYVPGSLPGAPAPYVITPVSDPRWTTTLEAEGALDSFYVAVKDAELVADANGNQAIRVYYEFTNNSDYSTSIGDELYIFTYQDGISLDYTNAASESETDTNYYTKVEPGSTITISCLFGLRNQTSSVEAEVEAHSDYSAVGQTYKITD